VNGVSLHPPLETIEHKLISAVEDWVRNLSRQRVRANLLDSTVRRSHDCSTRSHLRRCRLHGNVAVSCPGWPLMIAHHAPKISIKSAVLVLAAAVMWLILIAILTVV
jgi:hypothetical protein